MANSGTTFRLPCGEKPSRLMAFPRNHKKEPPGDFLASRSICLGPPNSSPPKQRRVRAPAPGPILGSAWTWGGRGGGWGDRALGLPSSCPGASAHLVCGLPHTHWENQTASHSVPAAHWLDSNEALTRPWRFYSSFITFILIWTRSLDFKVAWLCCCQFNASLHSDAQPVSVTHILLD